MNYSVWPWTLGWDEVDPARHPFDAAMAAEVVRRLAPASSVPVRPAADNDSVGFGWVREIGEPWVDALARAMVERFGLWAVGWQWAKDEGDFGGGPVESWCCAVHSLDEPEVTLRRVTNALLEWRGWLEDLAERFDRFPLDGLSSADRIAMWERGAVHLIDHIVVRTGAGDAWYRHCAQVLTWFLIRWGVSVDRAERLVDEAIGGRFESWCAPADTQVAAVAGKIARSADTKKAGPKSR